MAAYITFDSYAAMGGGANDAAFTRLEMKARKLIDSATHGRIAEETPVRESVKMCAFELIEAIAAQEAETGPGGREIASMSNDGVSISYNTAETHSAQARFSRIIREWLGGEYTAGGVNLLYCGVDA